MTRDGTAIHAVDFNFWGVTFTRDANRFYATLGTGGRILLVEGDVAARTLRVIAEDIECPSLSPDETHIAFKKRFGSGLDAWWQPAVLNLATKDVRLLPEPKHIDDQIEWLDDGHILYAVGHSVSAALRRADVWMLAIDGASPPSVFIPDAESPGGRAAMRARITRMAKPPVIAELVWTDALRFDATSGRIATVIDGDSTAGPSPVQMLVFGLAGCMAADVVDIVRKGRHPLTGVQRPHRRRARAGAADTCRACAAAVSASRRRAGGGRRARDRAVARPVLFGVALAPPGHRVDHVVRHHAVLSTDRGARISTGCAASPC